MGGYIGDSSCGTHSRFTVRRNLRDSHKRGNIHIHGESHEHLRLCVKVIHDKDYGFKLRHKARDNYNGSSFRRGGQKLQCLTHSDRDDSYNVDSAESPGRTGDKLINGSCYRDSDSRGDIQHGYYGLEQLRDRLENIHPHNFRRRCEADNHDRLIT